MIRIAAAFIVILTGASGATCQDSGAVAAEPMPAAIVIPTAGNSWVVDDVHASRRVITDRGIAGWKDKATRFRTYFKMESSGPVTVALKARAQAGAAKIRVSLGDQSEIVELTTSGWDTVDAGIFEVAGAGYHFVEIQGIETSAEAFPEIESLLLGGDATAGNVHFVKDDFYWGRRGPSVHLNYFMPPSAEDARYFYSEITVPDGADVLGSYFMANGFRQGYFGMQVNSPTERRILFSVWSPYQTDNPGEIPEESRIQLLKKGDGVYSGEFGNEGSGGQSYWRFPWKAGTTYGFLLKGEPTGRGETDFTAWFLDPEVNDWKLVASFRRPKTSMHLTGLHSFLENFVPETGHLARQADYSNQWIFDSKETWHELTKIKFTADATARKGARLDYAGGVNGQAFFLRNCGFFSETTAIDSEFERPGGGTPPTIPWDTLP